MVEGEYMARTGCVIYGYILIIDYFNRFNVCKEGLKGGMSNYQKLGLVDIFCYFYAIVEHGGKNNEC